MNTEQMRMVAAFSITKKLGSEVGGFPAFQALQIAFEELIWPFSYGISDTLLPSAALKHMTIEGLIATRRVEHDNPAFWYVLGYEGEFFIIVLFNEALDKDDLAFFLSCDFRSLHLGREPYEPAPRTANCVHIGFPIFAFPTASLLLGNKAGASLLTDLAT